MKLQLLVALIAASMLPSLSVAQKEPEVSQNIAARISREEPALRQAIQHARAKFDDYLRISASPPPGTGRFGVQIAISNGKEAEYVWVDRVATQSNSYSGQMRSLSKVLPSVKPNDRLVFQRDQIVDWNYFDEKLKRNMGHFMACAYLKAHETPEQAEIFAKRQELNCQ